MENAVAQLADVDMELVNFLIMINGVARIGAHHIPTYGARGSFEHSELNRVAFLAHH